MRRRLFSETISIPVMTEHDHYPVSYVKDILIDPETGKITAFLLPHLKIIVPVDVLEWKEFLLVHDEGSILHLNDVVKIRRSFGKECRFFNKKVFTEDGEYLGRIYDVSFDAGSGCLLQIFTAKGFFLFRWDSKVLDRSMIIEVKKEKIIVKNLLTKEKVKSAELSPA